MIEEKLKRELIIQFIEQFCQVKGKKFKLYKYQKDFILDVSTFRIVNKARQLGMSLVIAAEGVIEAMIDRNAVVLIVSSSEKAAQRVLDYCKQIYVSIPSAIRPNTCKYSAAEIQFTDAKGKPAGLLVSLANNSSTVRGYCATSIYVDEAAHFKEDDKMFAALNPSISRGGRMTVISSPCGRGNKFYDIWENNLEYSKHFIPYTVCPDTKYIESIERLRRAMDEVSFNQEYLCLFLEDNYAFFPEKLIVPCIDDELGQHYELKSKGTVYMGIDWAKKDASTAVIVGEHFNKDQLFIVRRIELFGKMPYEAQLKHIVKICADLEVEKIFCDQTGVGEKLYEDLVSQSGVTVEGIMFTLSVKEKLITQLRILFESESIRIPRNEELIKQLRSLERSYTDTGHIRFKHVGDYHDDLCWGLAMAVAAVKTIQNEVDFKLGSTRETEQMWDKDEKENMAKIRSLFL